MNCLMFCSFSGKKELAYKLDQYLVMEKQNEFLREFIEMGKYLNEAIAKFSDSEISQADFYFESAKEKLNRLFKNIPKEYKYVTSFLNNIDYFIELIKIINDLNSIIEIMKSSNDFKTVINSLATLRMHMKEVKKANLFIFYKVILDNYISLLIDSINLIIYDIDLNEKEFDDKSKVIEQNSITNHLLTIYIKRSYELKDLIQQYVKEYKSTTLKDILKESSKNKLINIVSNPKDIINNLEYVIYGDKLNFFSTNDFICSLVVKSIKSIQKVEPSFIKNCKNGTTNSLLESDFMENFYGKLSMIFEVTAEELSKEGRTDLIIKSKSFGERIFEFKVWGRNDYKEVVNQLNSYLIDMNTVGFIVMINPNKSPINKQYFQLVQSKEMNYIEDSYKEFNVVQFKYYCTKHNNGIQDKIIYHFIYNLY